jgi:hypothetical protein
MPLQLSLPCSKTYEGTARHPCPLLRFHFDRVQLKKGWYSPIAHGQLEDEQTAIRKLVLQLLSGQSALKMDVTSFPMNEDIANAQVTLQKAMSEAFAGRGALNVIVKNDGAAS